MTFSLVYLTNRENPCFAWFVDSLCRQVEDGNFPQVVFIDAMLWHREDRRRELADVVAGRFPYRHEPPKPCVWQGPHRLTTQDCFAAASARNTGICLASKPYIIFCDDLSVLAPGWLREARHAAQEGYVVMGAYRKVTKLVVDAGRIVSWSPHMVKDPDGKEHDAGLDCRWSQGSDNGLVPTQPSNLYGCSFGAPIEALLDVNGQDEIFDGMGYEDCALGYTLLRTRQKSFFGHPTNLFYNRNMLTYESEEMHHQGQPMKGGRVDKDNGRASVVLYRGGVAPSGFKSIGLQNDAGYVRSIGTRQNLRELRRQVLAGATFPVPTEPATHWYDNQPLKEI